MKPASFDYYRPESVAEALDLLARHGDGKILAGGQSLVPLMNMRLVQPEVLVDINRLQQLSYIRAEDGWLVIGALTRHIDIERSELVRHLCPLLARAVRFVGHRAIRYRGTIGGSIVHADPAAEFPSVLAALDGRVVVSRDGGERVVRAGDFFLSYLTSDVGVDEMVTEVRLPQLPPWTGVAFVELARRHGDFALVGVAAELSVDASGRCGQARVALAGVGSTPVRSERISAILAGQVLDDEVIREAAMAVRGEIAPEGDVHASATYRSEVAAILAEQAIRTALTEALGDTGR